MVLDFWMLKVLLHTKVWSFQKHFDINYCGNEVEPRYFVFNSGAAQIEIREGVGFWEISSVYTDSLEKALSGFKERIEIIQSDAIPLEVLPIEDVWRLSPPLSLPREFANQVPIFEVIREYNLRHKRERLNVRREFAQCEESLRVIYGVEKGNLRYAEEVSIKDEKIMGGSQRYSRPLDFNSFLIGLETGITPIEEKPALPEIKRKGYPNMKRLEDCFRSLPWQEDFNAIYRGSGFFTE
mgnify:CR=1 FL=1